MKKILIVLIFLPACAHVQHSAPARSYADLEAKLQAVSDLLNRCQPQGAYHLCESPAMLQALSSCAELYRSAGLCRADLVECRKVAGVDEALWQQQVADERSIAERYRAQRWWWAAAALAVGAVIGGGVILGVEMR